MVPSAICWSTRKAIEWVGLDFCLTQLDWNLKYLIFFTRERFWFFVDFYEAVLHQVEWHRRTSKKDAENGRCARKNDTQMQKRAAQIFSCKSGFWLLLKGDVSFSGCCFVMRVWDRLFWFSRFLRFRSGRQWLGEAGKLRLGTVRQRVCGVWSGCWVFRRCWMYAFSCDVLQECWRRRSLLGCWFRPSRRAWIVSGVGLDEACETGLG